LRKQGKRFFFEKKNQKTFIRWSVPLGSCGLQAAQRPEKVFASFFQTRSAFFLTLP
jgi:hypothetical protein